MDLQTQVDDLHTRLRAVEIALAENTLITKNMATDTKDLVEAFKIAKGTLTFVGFLGKVGKPIVFIGGGAAVLGHYWDAMIAALRGVK